MEVDSEIAVQYIEVHPSGNLGKGTRIYGLGGSVCEISNADGSLHGHEGENVEYHARCEAQLYLIQRDGGLAYAEPASGIRKAELAEKAHGAALLKTDVVSVESGHRPGRERRVHIGQADGEVVAQQRQVHVVEREISLAVREAQAHAGIVFISIGKRGSDTDQFPLSIKTIYKQQELAVVAPYGGGKKAEPRCPFSFLQDGIGLEALFRIARPQDGREKHYRKQYDKQLLHIRNSNKRSMKVIAG